MLGITHDSVNRRLQENGRLVVLVGFFFWIKEDFGSLLDVTWDWYICWNIGIAGCMSEGSVGGVVARPRGVIVIINFI